VCVCLRLCMHVHICVCMCMYVCECLCLTVSLFHARACAFSFSFSLFLSLSLSLSLDPATHTGQHTHIHITRTIIFSAWSIQTYVCIHTSLSLSLARSLPLSLSVSRSLSLSFFLSLARARACALFPTLALLSSLLLFSRLYIHLHHPIVIFPTHLHQNLFMSCFVFMCSHFMFSCFHIFIVRMTQPPNTNPTPTHSRQPPTHTTGKIVLSPRMLTDHNVQSYVNAVQGAFLRYLPVCGAPRNEL